MKESSEISDHQAVDERVNFDGEDYVKSPRIISEERMKASKYTNDTSAGKEGKRFSALINYQINDENKEINRKKHLRQAVYTQS